MDPETPLPFDGEPPSETSEPVIAPDAINSSDSPDLPPIEPYRGLRWILIGPQGLRGGWSIFVFAVLVYVLANVARFVAVNSHLLGSRVSTFTPARILAGEVITFLAILGAAAIVALIEHRSVMEFNLTGPRRVLHFFSGIATGFAALSVLIGLLTWGGWMHFDGVALSGTAIVRYALIWGCVFLLVGCVEEGTMRCYLQFTLTRSIDFWWALGIVVFFSLDLMVKSWSGLDMLAILTLGILRTATGGALGVYVIALLGLFPCLYLHLKKVPGSAFWQAAWVTSTVFGFGHTSNSGENWIGIFSAAAVGFVFCVSIWTTGSAWWAIGCHTGWDWAETYFYGTADSGVVAPGHFLSASPAGNPFWSGGTDGPEGSVLILPVLVLLLAALLLIYRRNVAPAPVPTLEQAAD